MRRCLACCAMLVAFGAGCGSGSANRPAPSAPPPPAAEATASTPTAPAPVAADEGAHTVTRSAVLDVLDKGIPWVLRQVETEPELANGRFVGFRLVTFFPGDGRFRGVDLRPGDVVLRINGLPIERPEHAYRVWQELRVASEIRVEVMRQGQSHEVDYSIIDG